MSTLIKIPGTDFFANATGFSSTVPNGLVGKFFPGGSRPAKNWAFGGTDASVVGTPTYNTWSTSFIGGISGNAHFATNIVDTTTLTLCAVVRSSNDGSISSLQPVWIGCNATNSGIGLYVRGTGKDALTWTYSNSGTPTADFIQSSITISPSFTNWRFIAASTDGTNYIYYDKTNSVVVSKTNANARYLSTSGNPFLIGNYYSSTRTGTAEIASVDFYNRVLSSTEVDTLYQSTKTYLATRSISI